ncbi:MAG: HlyD family efflux transporter periplasmic adaptor subunit [Phycisphaeraceae bacterium]|nr:HlyD family efflux transporter periplasmic adaptor subunit [Phycisphaeraceae bacterium]
MNMRLRSETISAAIKYATRALVMVLIVGIGVLIVARLIATAPEPERRAPDEGLRTVPVAELRPLEVQRSWTAIGSVRPVDAATITAEVIASIARAPELRAGDAVVAGQLLIELDDTDFRLQREIAESRIEELESQIEQLQTERQVLGRQLELEQENVTVARRQFERIESLFQRQASSQQDLDAARQGLIAAELTFERVRERLSLIPGRLTTTGAQLRTAQRQLAQADQNIRRARIVSPMDGVIQFITAEVGLQVQPGEVLARIVDPTRLEVPLRIPATARRTLAVGDEVEITADSQPEHRWRSRIVRIEPEDDVRTRTLTAFVRIDPTSNNPESGDSLSVGVLHPNAFVTATVRTGEKRQRWVVPRRAVRAGRIMIVEDERLRSVPVIVDFTLEEKLGAAGLPDEQWLVLADQGDLQSGMLYTVNYSAGFLDGQRVRPVAHQQINNQAADPDSED